VLAFKPVAFRPLSLSFQAPLNCPQPVLPSQLLRKPKELFLAQEQDLLLKQLNLYCLKH
jgi:hypothetical protein